MQRSYFSNCENGYFKSRNVASKNPAVSALQDLLFYQLTGIGFFAKNNIYFQKRDKDTDNQLTRLIYLSNKGMNFSISVMTNAINQAYNLKNRVENLYRFFCKSNNIKINSLPPAAMFRPADNLSQLVSQSNIINAQKSIKNSDITITAMQEIIRQSICSSANFLERIKSTDKIPNHIVSVLYDLLDFLSNNDATREDCENFALLAGELQIQVLELLVSTYEKQYGFIEHKIVSCDFKKGNAILVAGEDIPFLKKLLESTKDKSINIYTYGELNFAHAFPEINKYKNLAGAYIGKYNNISADIELFPGVVVLTSGNLEDLTDIYRGRIFSTEAISMLGITKIDNNDMKTIINAAYDAQGFENNKKNPSFEIGFGIKEFEEYEKSIIHEFKNKKIKNVMIFIGCNYFDGDKKYYKKIVEILPKDTAVITLDCIPSENNCIQTKPLFKFDFGHYVNLYNFVRLLFALAGKKHKSINDMPIDITINLKSPNSIAALLLLLSLGFKHIKINSDLPYYMTTSLLRIFEKKYKLSKIHGAKEDTKNAKNEQRKQ